MDTLNLERQVFHGEMNRIADETTASSSVVELIKGARAGSVLWQLGSSAILGTTTKFAGNTFALSSITMGTNAPHIDGRLLAPNGAVTLHSNTIGGAIPVPEAGTIVSPSAQCLTGLGKIRRHAGGQSL